MNTRRMLSLSLLVGLLLVPLAASADHHEMAPKPITWLSYLQSHPGKSTALTQNLAEDGAKIYDALMADGHILTWGVAMPVNHMAGDEWNVMEWVTFRDWAAVDSFMQAFMGMQMSKSPEDAQAEQKEWAELVVPGSHFDEILRHLVVVPAEGAARPGYYNLSTVPVHQGQGAAVQKIWVDSVQPVMAGLQGAGTIGAFGLATADVHDGSGSSLVFWTALPNLAARDAIDAAMEAAAKERGEEAQMAMMKGFFEATDFATHDDRIFLVVHYGGGSGGDGDGDGE